MARLPAQPNQSLIDGLKVIEALALAKAPTGSREMARRMGMEATRVNRLLKTLASVGLAQQTTTRQYVPGPGMHVLSVQAMYGSGLLKASAPVLESLRSLKLDVAMGVLWRREVCYLYFASPRTPTAEAVGGRGLFAAEISGIGAPLLASLTDAEIRRRYAGASRAELKRALTIAAVTRKQDYAYLPKSEERTSDVVGVAVGKPPFAAISLFGDIPRSRVPELVETLRRAAGRIVAAQEI
jgi:DNA-binding IclR family transcriptional regulator